MWYLIKDGKIEKKIVQQPQGDYEVKGKIIPKQAWGDNDLLAKHGIYPVKIVKPDITDNQDYGAPDDDAATLTRTYPVVDKPQDELDREAAAKAEKYVKTVKDEAYRRIVDYCPEWKQRNYTAAMTELLEIGKENWSAEQTALADFLKGEWARMKSVREASDVIEKTPVDSPTDDSHWPAFTHTPEEGI
jgi:hypothetical protein